MAKQPKAQAQKQAFEATKETVKEEVVETTTAQDTVVATEPVLEDTKEQASEPSVEENSTPDVVTETATQEEPVVETKAPVIETVVQTPETTTPAAAVITETATQEEPVVETKAPVIDDVVQTPETTTPAAAVITETAVVEKRSIIFQIAVADLDNYVKNMARNVPQTSSSGAMYQVGLYRTFQKFLSLEAVEFKAGMDTLLGVIYANRDDVFNDSNPFRFNESTTLRDTDRKLFNRLLNLFIVAAAPATRKAVVERVNLHETIKLLPTEQSKQLLIAYFS